MVTKEQVDAFVAYARGMVALFGDPNYPGGVKEDVIVALAAERDRLATQVAELVALVKDAPVDEDEVFCPMGDDEPCGLSARYAPCWNHRRAALLARIGATP